MAINGRTTSSPARFSTSVQPVPYEEFGAMVPEPASPPLFV